MADETLRLTEQERESIVCDCAIALAVDACPSHADDGDSLWTEQPASHILAAVEAIITAHDAEVRRTAAKETAERIAQAFTGGEFEENAAAAASEGEWSWFRWLALDAIARSAAQS